MKKPRKRTPKQKFDFRRRLVGDKILSFAAKTIATELLLTFHNAKNDRCNPSLPAIAKAAGCSRRTAFSAIAELKAAGWVAVNSTQGGGSNCTNRYSFDFEGVQTSAPRTSADVCTAGVQDTSSGVQTSAHELLRTTRASGARGERGKPPSQRAPDGALAREEELQELLQLWSVKPHGVNKDKARAAFLRVIANGAASPEKIINSARHWVEAKAKEPRFLPKLEEWLDNGAWQNDPPTQMNGNHHRPSAAQFAANLARQAREAERNGR